MNNFAIGHQIGKSALVQALFEYYFLIQIEQELQDYLSSNQYRLIRKQKDI